MKLFLKVAPCLSLFFIPQTQAATAWLKSQQVQGLRVVCTYEVDGRSKTVTLAHNEPCPAEMEIDLFSFSRKGFGDRKPAPASTGIGRALSGELVRGSSKTCAYRDGRGKATYRTVGTDASCPSQSDW